MKAKLHKLFLPVDYAMELYEKFHSLKDRGMTVREYTSEFINFSIRVGLTESNEQLTSQYLSGLKQSIRDEVGVVRLCNWKVHILVLDFFFKVPIPRNTQNNFQSIDQLLRMKRT